MDVNVIYRNLCPVCERELTLSEIEKGICQRTGRPFKDVKFERKLKDFEKFFREFVGSRPRNIQRIWAKRILKGESFAAIAPTGIGKTVFSICMAMFLSKEKKKTYCILPTTTLLENIREKVYNFLKQKKENINILFYHSKIRKQKEAKERLEKRDYDVLVTTNAFLAKNFDLIKDVKFDVIFVDDVDALMKASKNINRILMLAGYTEDEIKKGEPEEDKKGIFMISTATGTPGRGTNLFRKLCNFDVGYVKETVRNVSDIFVEEKSIEKLKEILRICGTGGLIFTTSEEEAKELYEKLKEDFNCDIMISTQKTNLKDFEYGKIDILIGVGSYYGLLVRGIDLPERIRYAIFYGAPRFAFRINLEDIKNGVALYLARVIARKEKNRGLIKLVNYRAIDKIKEILKEKLQSYSEEDLQSLGIYLKGDRMIIPDIKTYIQGSGRTSRLYAGGITKGLTILMEEDKNLLNFFIEKAMIRDITFEKFEEEKIKEILEEVDRDRENIRLRHRAKDLLKPILFIVESPNKARQIASFFGKPSVRKIFGINVYEVLTGDKLLMIAPTFGHMVDLTEENVGFYGIEIKDGNFIPVYGTIKRCKKCNFQFVKDIDFCPRKNCGSKDIFDAKNQIRALQRLALEMERVYIGTDPDTEGEKIAWDVYNLLKPYAKEIKRAEFHEVTKKAIEEALKDLRDIDENLVKAQLVRRIEDRWTGFELTKRLTKAFSDEKERLLSAGRVQSPVLKWIIDRTEEHKKKQKIFISEDGKIWINLPEGVDVKDKLKVKIKIADVYEKDLIVHPFTTNTMLRDASRLLRLSVKDVMASAQKLFEIGLITYHRTDSERISEKGHEVARRLLEKDFVKRTFGEGGAHEGIRITKPLRPEELRIYFEELGIVAPLTKEDFNLYKLIFNRFLASQTHPAKVKYQKVIYVVDGHEIEEERPVEASGKSYEFCPYIINVRDSLREGEYVLKGKVEKIPVVPLFTQSDVIAQMKERGIGRPSTYSAILTKLFERGYIYELNKTQKIIATTLGKKCGEYLFTHYSQFVSEERTKQLEEIMDEIERGEKDYKKVLEELYEEIQSLNKFNSCLTD